MSAYRDAPPEPRVLPARIARLAILCFCAFVGSAFVAPLLIDASELVASPWIALLVLVAVACASIVLLEKRASTVWWIAANAVAVATLVVPWLRDHPRVWREGILFATCFAVLTRPALSATHAWIPGRICPLTRYASAACGWFVPAIVVGCIAGGGAIALVGFVAFLVAMIVIEKRGSIGKRQATAFDLSWPAVAAILDVLRVLLLLCFPLLLVALSLHPPGPGHGPPP